MGHSLHLSMDLLKSIPISSGIAENSPPSRRPGMLPHSLGDMPSQALGFVSLLRASYYETYLSAASTRLRRLYIIFPKIKSFCVGWRCM